MLRWFYIFRKLSITSYYYYLKKKKLEIETSSSNPEIFPLEIRDEANNRVRQRNGRCSLWYSLTLFFIFSFSLPIFKTLNKFVTSLFHPRIPTRSGWEQSCRGWDLRWTKPLKSATRTTSLAPSKTTPTPSCNKPAKPSPRAPKSFRIAL